MLFEEQEEVIEEDEEDFEEINEAEATIEEEEILEVEEKVEAIQEDKSLGEKKDLKVKLFLSFLVLLILAGILLFYVFERNLKSLSQNFEDFFHFLSLNNYSKLFVIDSITYTDL